MKKFSLALLLLVSIPAYAMESQIIQIKTLTKGTFNIPIDENTTVQNLKEKIADQKNIPVENQKLIFAGKQLDQPTALLKDLQPSKSSHIHLIIATSKPKSIHVKTLTGKTFDIPIDERTTVGALKAAIAQQENMPIERQNIVYKNQKLDDTMLLKNAGIKEVTLVMSLQSPSYPKEPSLDIPEPSLAKKFSARFTKNQKIGAAAITTAALVAAVAGVTAIHKYKSTKKRLIKKYNLERLKPLQNKVWLATVLASYNIPWYLNSIMQHTPGSLTDFVGADPRALAELYYGHTPTPNELNAFLAKFFSGKN